MSHDSALLVSISADKSVKVFDVASFDMIAMLRLPYVPGCAEWIFTARAPCRPGACLSSHVRSRLALLQRPTFSPAVTSALQSPSRHSGAVELAAPRGHARQQQLDDNPCACCSAQRGEAGARLAIAERDAPVIHIYDARSGSDQPISSVTVRWRPAALAASSAGTACSGTRVSSSRQPRAVLVARGYACITVLLTSAGSPSKHAVKQAVGRAAIV